MALQDVCRSRDFFLDTQDCFSELFGGKNSCFTLSGLPFNSAASLFHFYAPVPEYLGDSPIEFGQIRSVQSSGAILSHNAVSLPAGVPPACSQSVPLPFPMSHGTTTLAFMFQGGVLAAADTRSSCSGLVECPSAQKILPIHSHLVGLTSGTSADCVVWKRILARELRLYQLRHGRRLSTAGAAKLLSHMLHPFKGTDLCVAATLCGWDGGDRGETTHLSPADSRLDEASLAKTRSSFTTAASSQSSDTKTGTSCGPSLYYVYSDGTRLQGTLFSVGSGSPYAYSILDQGVRWGLTVDEATSIAREAVYRATHRDAYSGNNVDVFLVSSTGWSRRRREDLKEEYYREKARRESRQRRDVTVSE